MNKKKKGDVFDMKNIFYIHTHDSGRMLSPYGYALPSPEIDKFADSASVFRNCHSASPTCSPSRSALLTGMPPHTNGMCGLAHRGWHLNDYSEHLVHRLKKHGYETILCGIQHVAPKDEMIGYDKIIGSRSYSMGKTELSMEAFDIANTDSLIEEIEKGNMHAPFFVSMGWYNTHREFPPIADDINPDKLLVPSVLPDCKQTREDLAGYATSLKIVDNCFGKLIDTLKKQNLYDDSLVIFTTDHGPAFPKMKGTLYDTGTGVFLMIKMPNQKEPLVLDQLVTHYDILPTILEVLNLEKDPKLVGKSLVPILNGEHCEIHDEIFTESSFHAAYEPKRAIRTKRWKYIVHFDPDSTPVICNIDPSISKDLLLSYGLQSRAIDRVQLFDLYLDPQERENLAGKDEFKDIESELKDKLLAWMKQTEDPLLDNWQMPYSKDAIINKRTCISPREKDYV